jgi:hypothetical protein
VITVGKINSPQDTCHPSLQRRMSPASTPPRQEPHPLPRGRRVRRQHVVRRNTRTSRRPLTQGELEPFFNGAWSIFDVLEMNFRYGGYDPDELRDFVAGVESQLYPQMGKLYKRRIEAAAR